MASPNNTLTEAIQERILFSTREINTNFRIKVYGQISGQKIDRLVGVAGLVTILGDTDLTNTLISKAFTGRDDKMICRLRRGIKVTFYNK